MKTNVIERKISELKKTIAKAKRERDESLGSLKTLMSSLKKEFDVDTLDEAKELKSKIEDELKLATERLEESYREIESKYDV